MQVHQQAFVLKLSDALRPLADPAMVRSKACQLLGQELGADWVVYGLIDTKRGIVDINRGYAPKGEPAIVGELPLTDFAWTLPFYTAGITIVESDTQRSSRIPPAERSAIAGIGMVALISVPLLKDGQLVGALAVSQEKPRRWTGAEIQLVQETAERIWDAIERARVENNLRQSEARFRLMADAVPQIVWITDADGRPEFFNRQWEDYIGTSEIPQTAHSVATTYVHPEDAGRTTAAFEKARATGEVFEVEHRIRGKNGGYRWFLVRAEPHRDPSSKTIRWFGASTDIHDRKVMEESLRESEARFRSVVESVRDYAIFTTDPLGRIESWPPGAEAVFGWTAAEAIGKSVDMIFLPEDRERGTPEAERTTARTRNVAPNVRWHFRKDGSRVFIEGSTQALRRDSDQARGFLIIAKDVTHRHAAETAVRDSETRLRLAVEVGRLATWDWDLQTGKVTWSEDHYKMDGYAVGEVTPSYAAWLARVHPEDKAETEQALRDARDNRQDYVHEFRSLHPDGEVRWLSARGRYFYNPAGDPVRMIGVMDDVTERREWEDRQKVLVAELQHRTRNLIAVVRTLASKTVKESASLDDFHARYNLRLLALSRVQGLLSRLEGSDKITFDELLLGELAAHGVDAATSGLVRIDGPRGVRLRSGTVQTFALALHELATNSVKYGALSTAGGHLAVTWQVVDDTTGRKLCFDWQESGGSMLLTQVASTDGGYGRELIERALPYQLGATTRYEIRPEGVHCTVELPISDGPHHGE